MSVCYTQQVQKPSQPCWRGTSFVWLMNLNRLQADGQCLVDQTVNCSSSSCVGQKTAEAEAALLACDQLHMAYEHRQAARGWALPP